MKHLLLILTLMSLTSCMRIEIIPIKIGAAPEKSGLSFMNEQEERVAVEANYADEVLE